MKFLLCTKLYDVFLFGELIPFRKLDHSLAYRSFLDRGVNVNPFVFLVNVHFRANKNTVFYKANDEADFGSFVGINYDSPIFSTIHTITCLGDFCLCWAERRPKSPLSVLFNP